MKFTLKTPCPECPFLYTVKPFLREERVYAIIESLEWGVFPCHKSTDGGYDEDENGEGGYVPTGNEIACAGALIMMENNKIPSQMLQIAERLEIYKPYELDMEAPVYSEPFLMADANAGLEE